MKCQKCENTATFFYRENINGKVTESCLCHNCAEANGFLQDGHMRFNDVFNLSLFDEFDTMFNTFRITPSRMLRGFPLTNMFGNTRTVTRPAVSAPGQKTVEKTAVDDTINKRREINMLREQMRTAAANEDFEKAAKLRDEIRSIEGGV